MKTLSFWKKSVYSALVFFGTVMVLSVGYAVWNNVMGQVSSGDALTAGKWNALVDNITDLNSRWSRVGSDIAFTGGNVGIGTASPGTPLHLYNTTPALRLQYAGNTGYGQIESDGNNALIFKTSGANQQMTINNVGKVGIGTSSPTDILTVSGGITATKFTTSTAWTVIPGNGTWNSNMFCRRVGSFLQIKGEFNIISGTAGGWSISTFPTLPSNCLPSTYIRYISGICWGGTTNGGCLTEISAAGNIIVFNRNSFESISFPGTYPAD